MVKNIYCHRISWLVYFAFTSSWKNPVLRQSRSSCSKFPVSARQLSRQPKRTKPNSQKHQRSCEPQQRVLLTQKHFFTRPAILLGDHFLFLCRERSVVVNTHTHPQTCTQTPTPQSVGNDPFESQVPRDSEDKDACRMNQLVQDGHRPPAQETTTDTGSQGQEPAAGPHHTAQAPAVSPSTALFQLFHCGVSGGHCIDVFVSNNFPFSLSCCLVCVFVRVLFRDDLCVCPQLFKKVVAAFSFMRKVERQRLRRGGLKLCYRLHVWNPTAEDTHKQTHTHTHSTMKTVCPSLKMCHKNLSYQAWHCSVVSHLGGIEIKAATLAVCSHLLTSRHTKKSLYLLNESFLLPPVSWQPALCWFRDDRSYYTSHVAQGIFKKCCLQIIECLLLTDLLCI